MYKKMVYIPIHRGCVRKTPMVGGSIVLGKEEEKRNTGIVNHASITGDGYLRKSNVVGGILNSGVINHETDPPQYKTYKHLGQIPKKLTTEPPKKEMRGAGLLDLVKVPQVKKAKKTLNSLKISL